MAVSDGRRSKNPRKMPEIRPWAMDELTPGILDTAKRRTAGIIEAVRERPWNIFQAEDLAQSCYLQGVADAVDAHLGVTMPDSPGQAVKRYFLACDNPQAYPESQTYSMHECGEFDVAPYETPYVLAADYAADYAALLADRDALRERADGLSADLELSKSWAARLASNLEEVLDLMPEIPEPNCSCHTNPPCGDCTEWSGIRDAIPPAKQALASYRQEKPQKPLQGLE